MRVHDIEMLGRQAPAKSADRTRTNWRQFEMFLCGAFGERTANRANNQLMMSPPSKASGQRQQ